ncbi:response regulator transcription factor [uncultured Ellagibacter sp.]|uniref:response regulator transcription factor n=1 Tax=uncultured Ellagibacter sp. TaxID=2137580 RepID=UPI002611D097|nr:helix-turn-helix transcriptional regulator [uncultured Ellagibacter sp.]
MGKPSVTTQAIVGIPALFYCFALQKLIPALDPLGPAAFSPFIAYGISNIVCGAAALALVLLASRVEPVFLRRALLISGIGSQIAYALIWLAFPFAHPILMPALACAALLLRSIGIVFVSALWIDLCATLNPVRASFLNAVCIAISLVLYFFVMELDHLRIGMLAILLSAIICLAYWTAQGRYLDDGLSHHSSRHRIPLLRRTAIFVAVYSLTSNVITSTIATGHSRFASLIPALIIIVFILFQAKQFNAAVLYRMAFPWMVAGFLLASVVTSSYWGISGIILDAGSAAMGMLLFLVVCSLSYSTGASALSLFGILSAVQFCASFLGAAIGELIRCDLSQTGFGALLVFVVLAVVVVSCYFMSEDSLLSFFSHRDRHEGESTKSAEEELELKISLLSVSYSLTEREAEILQQLAQGRSNSDMANAMFISESTVKTHLHHIYQKFGVHKRKELEEIIAKRR